MRRKWHVAPSVPPAQLSRFPNFPPFLVQVLYNRGLSEPLQVHDFLTGHWSTGDPLAMRDMARAVEILLPAIKHRTPIAVYGDFDADGVTATALLTQTLAGLGADVRPYIPKRLEEGYGLNLEALRKLYRQGVRLVVTVDCGIRSIEEIERARCAIEFVVTDHHSVGPQIPPAAAVLNPKRPDCEYPFKELAGVGVAYKLAQALIREASRHEIPVHIEEESLLDLVALGTVADMVPLLGENRYLVQRGLEVINAMRREGVRALVRAARIQGQVSATTISFALGPRLNAAGRIDDAEISYRLLVTCDPVEADRLARILDEHNRHRQSMTMRDFALAEKLALQGDPNIPLLCAASEQFNSGIVGLVAGKLTEAHYRPAVVVERGPELCKGSCRSIPEFDITRALDECRDLLVRHGGHAAAAGFTVLGENLDRLFAALADVARRELGGKELLPTLHIDAQVSLFEMDWAAAEWLKRLEPCGYANPAPLFLSRGLAVLESRPIGPEKQHLKLKVGENHRVMDAIAFGLGERCAELGQRVDLVYSLEVNEWHGERTLQLNVQDIRPAAD